MVAGKAGPGQAGRPRQADARLRMWRAVAHQGDDARTADARLLLQLADCCGHGVLVAAAVNAALRVASSAQPNADRIRPAPMHSLGACVQVRKSSGHYG